MPIIENDPWRQQYFSGIACPDNVIIPTDDQLAYQIYPAYRWIYNKLIICETQGIAHAPHNIMPPLFPVFSKPIYNLRGMGMGGAVIHSIEEYDRKHAPSHMWMELLAGEHVSTDVVLIDGEPHWWRHTLAAPLDQGMFDYWTVSVERHLKLEEYCAEWLRHWLKGYTGCVNLETIGGKIIEAHLRFSDQWPDLYGKGWAQSVVDLYANQRWHYPDTERSTGYCVILFGRHGVHYPELDPKVIEELGRQDGVSSLQITFYSDKLPEQHAMPTGDFRLAVINCWDLDVGRAIRTQLAALFDKEPSYVLQAVSS